MSVVHDSRWVCVLQTVASEQSFGIAQAPLASLQGARFIAFWSLQSVPVQTQELAVDVAPQGLVHHMIVELRSGCSAGHLRA
jgi:hypothetical protein